jgi:hypothetical protein
MPDLENPQSNVVVRARPGMGRLVLTVSLLGSVLLVFAIHAAVRDFERPEDEPPTSGRPATAFQPRPEPVSEEIAALMEALESPRALVRADAARRLRSMGAEAAPGVTALLLAMGDSEDVVRSQARRAIVTIGEAGIPRLIEALDHPDAAVRASAATILGRFGQAANSAIPALTRLLEDPVSDVRSSADRTLKLLN